MGYTAYRAWTTGATSLNPETVALAKQGATLYTVQLALNLIWTPLYFSLHKPVAATADILALGGTVGYLAYIWGQVDPVCGWLLAPYLGWLSFATYLCVCPSSSLQGYFIEKLTQCAGRKWRLEQLGLQADIVEEGISSRVMLCYDPTAVSVYYKHVQINGWFLVHIKCNDTVRVMKQVALMRIATTMISS